MLDNIFDEVVRSSCNCALTHFPICRVKYLQNLFLTLTAFTHAYPWLSGGLMGISGLHIPAYFDW